MKRIAIIEDGYVRDSQVFNANPEIMEADENWEDNYADIKYPCQYVGIFEGDDEESIKKKAAEIEGVHSDVITLVNIGYAPCNQALDKYPNDFIAMMSD